MNFTTTELTAKQITSLIFNGGHTDRYNKIRAEYERKQAKGIIPEISEEEFERLYYIFRDSRGVYGHASQYDIPAEEVTALNFVIETAYNCTEFCSLADIVKRARRLTSDDRVLNFMRADSSHWFYGHAKDLLLALCEDDSNRLKSIPIKSKGYTIIYLFGIC